MKGKSLSILLTVLICISLLFTACTREEAEKISLKEVETQPAPTLKKDGLKIAVSAMISPKETFKYYREILDYISVKMGMPVELIQRDTYAEVNNLVRDDNIHAAFVCTGAYIDGDREFGMELLVAPEAYGEPYYYSYIIVHKDSNATKFEDLRGKKFAFTDPISNTGKLSPTFMLAKMNETPESFFAEYIYTFSHDKSIEAVVKKLVDGASVDSLIWDYTNVTNPEFTSRTRLIQKSPPYGIPPVVVPGGLAPEIKETLRDVLLNMHLDKEGKSILDNVKIDRFIIIENSAYDYVREMRKFVDERQK